MYKAPYAEFNAYQREYAQETENVWYLDINDFIYETTEDIVSFQGFRYVFVEECECKMKVSVPQTMMKLV